jgi:hypothetical protein
MFVRAYCIAERVLVPLGSYFRLLCSHELLHVGRGARREHLRLDGQRLRN